MRIPLPLAFATVMAATPVAAENLVLNPAPQKSVPERNVQYVEAHDALILDASGSMDEAEIIAMLDGVRDYYTSDNAAVLYETGTCLAATVIFYGDRPFVKPTYILCSREDANRFVDENVDLVNISEVRSHVGNSATYLGYGLKEAINVFQKGDVETMRRRVVIVSDADGGVHAVLNKLAVSLSYQFGATVSGVSFGSGGKDVQKFFAESIVTPPESKYLERQYDGSLLERPLVQGRAYTASSPADLSAQLNLILNLGGA